MDRNHNDATALIKQTSARLAARPHGPGPTDRDAAGEAVSNDAERIAQLETALALLIDHVDAVGCFYRFGERLGDQVPAVQQARLVWGEEAMRRAMRS